MIVNNKSSVFRLLVGQKKQFKGVTLDSGKPLQSKISGRVNKKNGLLVAVLVLCAKLFRAIYVKPQSD